MEQELITAVETIKTAILQSLFNLSFIMALAAIFLLKKARKPGEQVFLKLSVLNFERNFPDYEVSLRKA